MNIGDVGVVMNHCVMIGGFYEARNNYTNNSETILLRKKVPFGGTRIVRIHTQQFLPTKALKENQFPNLNECNHCVPHRKQEGHEKMWRLLCLEFVSVLRTIFGSVKTGCIAKKRAF